MKWNELIKGLDAKSMEESSFQSMMKDWWSKSQKASPITEEEKEQAWKAVHLHSQRTRNKTRRIYYWSAAASIILIFGLVWVFIWYSNYYSTSKEEKLSTILTDGSQITLNSESSLDYSNIEENGVREVVLKGEAYFNVREDRDRQFNVRFEDCLVTVLGTSFNIKARKSTGEYVVTVTEGRVKFTTANQDVILGPNDNAVYNLNSGKVVITTADLNDLAWYTGVLYYRETPMKDVLEDIVDIYDLQINLLDESSLDCTVTTHIEFDSVDEILEVLELTLGISFKLINKSLVVDGSCN